MVKNNELNNTDRSLTEANSSSQYRLDTECGRTKKAFRNILIGITSLALSVIVGICSYTGDGESVIGSILSVLLALLAVGFFVIEIIVRARFEKNVQLAMDKSNQSYFADAEVIPVFSTERMLHSDPDNPTPQGADRKSESTPTLSYDTELGVSDSVTKFTVFAKERGCQIDADTAKGLFASLASSRILMLRHMPTEDFSLLVNVISEYFGTKIDIDQVDGGYTDVQSLLFETVDGEYRKKAAMLTVEAAQAEKDKLHFIALTGVIASNMANFFLPFIDYAKAPEASHRISSGDGEATQTVYLPHNLWVVLNLAEGERIASLPEALLEGCSIRDVSVSACGKAESPTEVQAISYSQLKMMIDKSKCNVAEGEWKKIDAFTDFLNQHVPFEISNKQWIGMEKYIAVLNECGVNTAFALDEAISTKIVPSVLVKVLNADEKIDITAGLNASFGDGELPISRRAIKELSGSGLRK